MADDEPKLKLYRGVYAAVWRDGGRTLRASMGTADRGAAERRFSDWNHARKRPGVTVEDIAFAYMADKAGKASHEIMGHSWKPLKLVFGHLRPDQVSRALSRAYAEKRRRAGKSESTIVRELSFLRAALRWQNKATTAIVEVPSAPPPRSYHLTRSEWQLFREAARPTPHLYLFAVLAYTTAARSQAILELTWDRVNFAGAGRIDFGAAATRYKGRALVPMNATARAALEAAKPAALTDRVIEWTGRPVKSIKRAFAAAAERAGFPNLTPHVLRHTAAVHLVEAGIPMSEISQYLGHSSTATTERVYARYSLDYLRKAASVLD